MFCLYYLSVFYEVVLKCLVFGNYKDILIFFFFLVMVLVVKEGSLLAKNCGFFFWLWSISC